MLPPIIDPKHFFLRAKITEKKKKSVGEVVIRKELGASEYMARHMITMLLSKQARHMLAVQSWLARSGSEFNSNPIGVFL
jgi:hypothetical protein